MSGVIDLTSESPPQPPRTLAGHAGTSASASTSTSAPSTPAPTASRSPAPSSSSASRVRFDPTATRPRPMQHDPDGSIEFVGMNVTNASRRREAIRGARREAMARDVESARTILENGPPSSSSSTSSSSGFRIRDDLPAGPHRARPNLDAAAGGRGFLRPRGVAIGHSSGGMTGGIGSMLARMLNTGLFGAHLGFGFGGSGGAGTANGSGRSIPTRTTRGGGRRAAPPPELPIPEKFSPSLTEQDGDPGKGFSFGIVEPPVEVEHFDEDPHAITGPLPDTTAICARCEFALVQGGTGDKRVWALCCGHVLDGRCVEELCGRKLAARKREIQLDLWKANVETFQAASGGAETTTTTTTGKENHRGATKGKGKGKARLISDLDDGLEADADVATLSPPSKASRSDLSQTSTRHRPNPTAASMGSTTASGRSSQGKLTRSAAAAAAALASSSSSSDSALMATPGPPPRPSTPPFKPKAFQCPVQGCGIKSRIEPNHPNSAIELFI